MALVPLTPSVLASAIEQSGFTQSEIAKRARVNEEALAIVCTETLRLNWTQFNTIRAKLLGPDSRSVGWELLE